MTASDRNPGADLATYEDDGALVICCRRNPNAWIRSDTTVSLSDIESDARMLVP